MAVQEGTNQIPPIGSVRHAGERRRGRCQRQICPIVPITPIDAVPVHRSEIREVISPTIGMLLLREEKQPACFWPAGGSNPLLGIIWPPELRIRDRGQEQRLPRTHSEEVPLLRAELALNRASILVQQYVDNEFQFLLEGAGAAFERHQPQKTGDVVHSAINIAVHGLAVEEMRQRSQMVLNLGERSFIMWNGCCSESAVHLSSTNINRSTSSTCYGPQHLFHNNSFCRLISSSMDYSRHGRKPSTNTA